MNITKENRQARLNKGVKGPKKSFRRPIPNIKKYLTDGIDDIRRYKKTTKSEV